MSRNQFSSRFLVLAVLVVLAALLGSLLVAPSAYAYDNEELAFLTLINNHRAQNGLPGLTMSNSLYNASEGHSYDMGTRGYFAHNTPEGVTPWDRIRAAGYTYNTWLGENIAAGYGTAQTVFNAWRSSPVHNANMLSANYRAIGIGRYYVNGSTYGWYWTTDFGGVVDFSYSIDPAFIEKYNALGGAPGAATNDAQAITGGSYQNFTNGRLYWNQATGGIYWIHGAILSKYDLLGSSILGLPTSDEYGAPGGRAQNFTGGRMTWSSATGAHEIHGVILTKFDSMGGTTGCGFPTTDVFNISGISGAQESDFQGARIYTSANGTYEVHGAILSKFLTAGGLSWYGLPTSDEIPVPGGDAAARMNQFQYGNVYWSPWTGAHVVYGAILTRYLAIGAAAYGFPVTDVFNMPGISGAQECDLQGARLYWSAATDVHEVHGAILSKYLTAGGPSWYGLPTSDEQDVAGAAGAKMNQFRYANVYWSAGTGAHVVYGDTLTKYIALGAAAYGMPVTDTFLMPGLSASFECDLQYARMYWSADTGAHEVHGAILSKYLTAGGPSWYGLPTSDEQDVAGAAGAKMNQFRYANVYWSAGTGAHVVYGAILAKYIADVGAGGAGGPTGQLGLPTSDQYYAGGSTYRNDFQHGYIWWNPWTEAEVQIT